MKPLTFYQSANLNDQEVIDQFVVRQNEFQRVISEIERDKMSGSIQHYIFIGQRGSGKSTLLRRIQAEINTKKNLSSRLVVINLSEEQAGIYKLHDLWDRVCQELQVRGFNIPEVKWQDYSNDLIAYSRQLYLSAQQGLQENSMKLVLLLDNIDRILENITETENHLLRELLMNHKDLRIIGGSTRLSEHHWKYEEPFYEFFQIITLESLSTEEFTDLLLFWSKHLNEPQIAEFVQNHPGQLSAVRILSDGMPRTMLNFVELLINRPEQHGYDYLRSIIDRATPIYQERLANLSPLNQKVVLELSFFWEAVKVKELSQAARLESKKVSAVLGQLVDLGIIEKIKGKGKNYMYRLKERFFNLWLVMTQGGPRQKNQVKGLTIFLETWYDSVELKSVYSNFTNQLSLGNYTPNGAIVMTKALAHSKYLSTSERDTLLDHAIKCVGKNDEFIKLLPPTAREIFIRAKQHLNEGRYDAALNDLNSIEQNDSYKDLLIGSVMFEKGELDEAEKHFKLANRTGEKGSLFWLGCLYYSKGDTESAKKYYLKAIDDDAADAYAMCNLGLLYEDQNELQLAEKYYLKAAELNEEKAMYNLGILYTAQNKFNDAEKIYLKAIDHGHIGALNNLAYNYSKANNSELARKYYLNAIEAGSKIAFFNFALFNENEHNLDEAEKYYLKAIEESSIYAMNNLATLYLNSERYDDAIKYYKLAVEQGHKEAQNNLASAYMLQGNDENAYDCLMAARKQNQYYSKRLLANVLYLLNKDKELALELIKSEDTPPIGSNHHLGFLVILVWAGNPEVLDDSVPIIEDLVENKKVNELIGFIMNLLTQQQYNIVWQWFQDQSLRSKLMELVRPLYHVTAKLKSNSEENDELLAQSPELIETVENIYDFVIEKQKFYQYLHNE